MTSFHKKTMKHAIHTAIPRFQLWFLLGISEHNDDRVLSKKHFTDESILVDSKSFLLSLARLMYLQQQQKSSLEIRESDDSRKYVVTLPQSTFP